MCCAPLNPHTLLTCGSDGTVHLIDLREPVPSILLPDNIRTVPQVLGGGPVDSSHSTNRRPLVKMQQQVYAVDWNRTNGTEFVTASGWGELRVYDVRKGDSQNADSCHLSFKGLCDGEVTGCAWSKDGRRLVGSWLGGSAYTFDVEAGTKHFSYSAQNLLSMRVIPNNRCCHVARLLSRAAYEMRRELENFYNERGRLRYIDRCSICSIFSVLGF
jgi:WD40 repeat protein